MEKAKQRLLSGKFADFHILCDGREIPVHRMVISEESRVLNSACSGTTPVSIAGMDAIESLKSPSRVPQ